MTPEIAREVEKEAARRDKASRKVVDEIAGRHFGEAPRHVCRSGGGLTNAVYRFRVSQGDFVVRMHEDATKIADYLKEQWAMNAARAAGVPVPTVLEVANFSDGRAYMISAHVHGVEARRARDRLAVLEDLGRAAAALHGVRTGGYGPVFDWTRNRLSRHERWADYLAGGFDVERRLCLLLRHRVIDRAQAARLRGTAEAMSRWMRPGVLHHGDLRLKNAIVDPASGRLAALIDWEACTSSPGPYWDLSLALHDLGVDEKEAFLGGYGMSPRRFEAALPFLRLFNALNYAGAVQAAAERGQTQRLAWLRLRLRAGLDLYER